MHGGVAVLNLCTILEVSGQQHAPAALPPEKKNPGPRRRGWVGPRAGLDYFEKRYEGHLESKERFAIQRYLLIIGKKKNMQVL